jgi:threonine aldolase
MTEQIIDLRSDTVTQPTPGMRKAMMDAPLGDDVWGDDPTVNELQERCASMFGKEDACFVPSGTMANQLAIRAQTQPGDEIIIHSESHIVRYEGGAAAALSGCSFATAYGERGFFTEKDVHKLYRPADFHFGQSRLVSL